METNEYEKTALKFLKDTKTEFKAEFLRHGVHFEGETDERDIYLITLKRGGRVYGLEFGQSLLNSGRYINGRDNKKLNKYQYQARKNKDFKEPSAYDVLSCLTTYDPEDFNNFCDNFGYNTDSIKAEKIYKAILDEWNNLKMLYSDDELNKLGEIQ